MRATTGRTGAIAVAVGLAWSAPSQSCAFGGLPVHNVTQGTHYQFIQEAINAANAKDQITMDPGVYFEILDFLGKQISVMNPTLDAADVVIDGTTFAAGTLPVVTFANAEGLDTQLGFVTVTGGSSSADGAGIRIAGASPSLINCLITGNHSTGSGRGGGIAVINGGGVLLTGCAVVNNSSPNEGGGLFVENFSSAHMDSSSFSGNSSNGGGAINNAGQLLVLNSAFTGNFVNFDGAAILSLGNTLTMVNCRLYNNLGNGSAVANLYGNTASLTGCTFSGNQGVFNGGFDSYAASATITNCIFWGDLPGEILHQASGTTTVTFSDVQGGWSGPGTDNIDADPLFVLPDGSDAHLTSGSPCVNAGDDDTPFFLPVDLDGQPRIQECRTDMGAYESTFIGADCNVNGAADACDIEQDTYVIDDGTMDSAISFDTPNHTFANQYDAGAGRVVGAIAVAFNDSMQAGDPVTVYLWDDPNNDGLPADAVLLASTGGVIGASSNNNGKIGDAIFDVFPITPTNVTGSFFVGAATSTGGFPMTFDETIPVPNRGWITSAFGTIDGAQVVENGNLMVRARFASDANADNVPDSCESPNEFGAPQEFIAVGEPGIQAVGDLDGNGTIDVVAVIPDLSPLVPGLIQVFLNNGVDDGKWLGLTPLPVITVGRAPTSVAVGLFNGDPKRDSALDLAVTNAGDDNVLILINLGNANFVNGGTVPVGNAPSSVVALHLNDQCDLFVDLAVSNELDSTVTLLFGDGNGGFSETNPCLSAVPAPPLPVALKPLIMSAGDFDGNKCPDLAGASTGAALALGVQPGIVFVLLSNGNGTMQPPAFYPVGENPLDLGIGDINHDTFPDITSANAGGLGTLTVLLNDGTGLFSTGVEIPVGPGARSVDAADLDGDADPDLAVVAQDPTIGAAVIVLQNIGDDPGELAFGAPVATSVDADPNFVVAADMNGDPALDLVTVNSDDGPSGGSVSVLLNTTLVAACPWDVGGDGEVGIADFLNLLQLWGTNPGGPPDFNNDGIVDYRDFEGLLMAWGACPG